MIDQALGGVNPADIDRDILEHGGVKVEKKIVVPAEMKMAAWKAACVQRGVSESLIETALEAALRWLSENPIVPKLRSDIEHLDEVFGDTDDKGGREDLVAVVCEWQRRMFLAPEPEIPEEIKDVMAWCDVNFGDHPRCAELKEVFSRVYLRGLGNERQAQKP